jgi:hypothetical protein
MEGMDADLRNGVWNVLHEHFFEGSDGRHVSFAPHCQLWVALWRDFFKRPVDSLPNGLGDTKAIFRDWFAEAPWFEIYDVAEFIIEYAAQRGARPKLVSDLNEVLQRELSAYRILDQQIVPISSPEELASIDAAIAGSGKSEEGVASHLAAAIALFSNRRAPDYRNSIKESISAVESLVRVLAEDPKAELGKALKALEGNVEIHPALDKAFRALYGYTSDEGGIRHAMMEASTLDAEDAQYMLIACSAFINYLRVKARKSGRIS